MRGAGRASVGRCAGRGGEADNAMKPIGERAEDFERSHERKTLRAGPHTWHYSAGGRGEPVLLLTGGVGIGIAWLDLAPALRPRYRTIAVDYPPTVASFDDLAAGALAVLDAEGAERAYLVGQSAGAMLAEVVSRRAPQRVRSMTLSGR